MDGKLKSENMQKEQFSEWGCRERRYADHIFIQIYSRVQNAPFRSQIFKIFLASGGKGALTPLTKILQTFLAVLFCSFAMDVLSPFISVL